MTAELLAQLIFAAGIAQLGILIASSLVPFRLNWKEELKSLSRLHRQMYWTYGGYVAIFWGIRLGLQPVFDVKEHLTARWLKAGYHSLTLLFASFTVLFGYAALRPG